MRDRRTAVMLVALALLSLLTLVLVWRIREADAAYAALAKRADLPFRGYVVPTIRAPTLAGDTLTVGELPVRHQRQVVFVFTTTCRYCLATLPVWEQVADFLGRLVPPVQVLGLSLDSVPATAEYSQAHGIGFPVGWFPDWKAARLFRALMVPQTLVLSHVGEVLYAHVGRLEQGAGLDSLFLALTARDSSGASREALKQ